MSTETLSTQTQAMRSYYRFQSRIYDATRWSFLFGRKKILQKMSLLAKGSVILEVGCGTGHNLHSLARRHPQSQITGIDISADMIQLAKKKTALYPQVRIIEKAYGNGDGAESPVDAILFSYCLTMINPQWKDVLFQAFLDLKPGGKIYVVDFHSSQVGWFRRHMANHHVRMEAHLDEFLETHFPLVEKKIQPAYGGLWNYFLYVGSKA